MYMHTFRYSDFYVNLHFPFCAPSPSSIEGFSFQKELPKKLFMGGDFWEKFKGRGTWRD